MTCDVCKKPATADELVPISGKNVCAKCKPDVVMNVKSGVSGSSRIGPQRAAEIKRKISRLNLLSFAFAVPGILLQFGPAFAAAGQVTPETAGSIMVVRLLGAPLIIAGLVCYALMKGRSGLLGLLGLLSCLGLIILHFFPKNCHNCRASGSYSAKACATCDAPM